MNRNLLLVIAIVFFSILAGYLLSGISFVGRAGISIFYQQYQFLKIWWKGALLVFAIWIFLFFIQTFLYKKAGKPVFNRVSAILILSATAGLFFSYIDFRRSLSHRWLGERFHLGVYLFWSGWIAISVFILQTKNKAENINIIRKLD